MSPSSVKTTKQRPTHTVEDYLMNMHVLERDHGEIVAARLAEILQVTPATVANTLSRMERDDWISGRGRGKNIHLTETGREAAHSVMRRHMLTEWLLLKILKLPFQLIHVEAHNMEHAISPLIEEQLTKLLGNPSICPHGNPFPGREEATRDWTPLTGFAEGERVIIRRLHELAENNVELLDFMIRNDILPGQKTIITEILPFNQTLSLELDSGSCTLGYAAASKIFAEKQT
jgi:DtxR family Mn-dependent transcriptional regulator